MDVCRYSGKPLGECQCKRGCETNHIKSGEWVQPARRKYRMSCCDCGLVHLVDFRIHKGHIQMRLYRESEIVP